MTRAAVAAAVLGLAFPSDIMPPPQYRGDVRAVVITTSTQAETDAGCGKAAPSMANAACAKVGPGNEPYVIIPNPCRFAERAPDGELYAAMLCHELGHVQGWRHPK